MKKENSGQRSDLEKEEFSRRGFLKLIFGIVSFLGVSGKKANASLFKSPVKRNQLRPPGAVPEEIFAGKCIRCGRCAEVCPYRCIYMLDARWGVWAGTPLIFVEKIPCYLCMKCVEVCPTGTLIKIKQEETRMGLAVINKRYCVSWLETALCRSCYNACPFKDVAIKLERLKPVVIDDKCTGCGLCVHACPMNPKAINIEPIYSFVRVKWK